jgi:hypothetical protein
MEELNEFLKNTGKKWHARKISDNHKEYLNRIYPSYGINQQIQLYIRGFATEPLCRICGGVLHKITAKTCSIKCRNIHLSDRDLQTNAKMKAKKTTLRRYGVDNVAKLQSTHDKRLVTMIERYGAKVSPLARRKASERLSNPELQEKIKRTFQYRYGVDNASQINGHGDRCKKTMLEHYGVPHFTQTDNYNKQKMEARLQKWINFATKDISIVGLREINTVDFINPNDRIEFTCECGRNEALASETFKWRINNLGTPCGKCSQVNNGSKAEREIADWLEQYTEVSRNDRSIISPLELDIYLPEYKVAIEYNGLYWHNELRKDRNYHLDKTNKCLENGVRLIHIFEDEYENTPTIVKDRLKNMLGINKRIYARKCEVKKIKPTEANAFIKKYHIQGSGRANVHLGLWHNSELVAVMTFLNGDISKGITDWELNRFCNKSGVTVVGGASKLFKYFTRHHSTETIISYADRRWSAVSPFYEKLGFEHNKDTVPNYWYILPSEMNRTHRYALRKPSGCGDTERELRLSEGYLRIYDCGSSKYIWRK